MLEVNDDMPPTLASEGCWLYAWTENIWYPHDTDRSGKWLVFLSSKAIDQYWQLIRLSLAMWRLGSMVKVSVSVPPGKDHVICVYTYDYADRADVMRIREELDAIGILWPIAYKANWQTREGFYGSKWPIQSEAGRFVPIYRV